MFAMIEYLKLRFVHDEDGLALTEYLVLLGLLVGGVIAAVIAFSGGLSDAWDSWTGFFTSNTVSYKN